MTRTVRILRFALAAGTGLMCLFINDNLSGTGQSSLVTQANAVIGRPRTPGSVAGVARRTTRRAVRRGVIVGAAAAGAAAVGVDAYYGGAPYDGAAPYYGIPEGYGYGPGPVPGAVIVNPVTGRWCTTEPSGYQWCWTP